MTISIIIPLWQGEDTIADCLHALDANTDGFACEIICVDNDSPDESAAIVAGEFPHVRLLAQPVNLGFAGGVNAGIDAAQGDLFVLLNQDCLVMLGWLSALVDAIQQKPEYGIAGCTILNDDGTINHAGAYLSRPGAYGVHLTEIDDDAPKKVDYVTGAVFAIRREAWEAVGPFDADFYPAYFEETDYCYRARSQGFETIYVPDARAKHLFSGREWKADPVKHASNQHQSRFRFFCKHFDGDELTNFFDAELEDIADENYIDQLVGRIQGARRTLRNLPDILERRSQEMHLLTSPVLTRQLSVGFTAIWQKASARVSQLIRGEDQSGTDVKLMLETLRGRTLELLHELRGAREEAERLRQLQAELLDRIYFQSPMTPVTDESTLNRLVRLVIKRPASILSGRDYLLRSKLNVLQAMHMTETDRIDRCVNDLMELTSNQLDVLAEEQRVLRLLTDYEYR